MKRFFLLHLLSNVWRSEFNNSDIAVSKDAHTDYWNELLEGEVALKFFYFLSVDLTATLEMVFDTISKKYFCYDRNNVGTTRDKRICFVEGKRENDWIR